MSPGHIGNPFYNEIKDVVIQDKVKPEKKRRFEKIMNIKKGDIFGELALLANKKRAATITCMTDCHFAVLDRKSFQIIR